MKGIDVKKILQKNGFTLKDIASTMGETPQNLNAMLKVEDIKTGVLERIAKSINKDVTFFFGVVDTQKDEIEIINSIVDNRRQINYLYQRIVDVNILINDYLKIEQEKDYIEDAAEILNTQTRQYPQEWKELDINGKRLHNENLKEAVRILQEMFFERFKVLYKNIRNLE